MVRVVKECILQIKGQRTTSYTWSKLDGAVEIVSIFMPVK